MAVAERHLNKKFRAHTFNQLAKSAVGPNWMGTDEYVQRLNRNLNKAMATGNISGFGNGTALVLQNLDSVMTSVLYDEEQLVKQRWINHVASINPQFQWNRRNQYGSSRGAMAFAEGGIGPVGNGSWTRNTQPVTFFGVQRGTTVIANLAGALGGMFDDPVEEENYDGTMQLMGGVEHALTWGNASITDASGDTIFYDGFYRQLRSRASAGQVFPTNIIDLHGKPMSFDVISEISALMSKVYVTTARDVAGFLSPDSLQTLQLLKSQAERNTDLQSDGGFRAGTPIEFYRTNLGSVPLIQDVFLQPFDQGTAPLTTADTGSPTKPSGVTAAAGAPTGSQVSNWLSGDAGTVYYSVSAFNAQGESLPFLYTTGVTVAVGQVVTVTIPNVTGAYGYRVYRGQQNNGSDANWIGDTAYTSTANATFVDDNSIMPGTDCALFLNKNPQNLVIPQMAPLLKLPLAIQNTTIPFGLLFLHTLAIKAPERQFMVVNIGKTNYNS